MRVAIESGKGMKVKVVKLCWNKWNGPFLCISMTNNVESCKKNQWKGSNFQIQCFYNGTSGALCWKRQKTPKLEKLKRKLLNFLKMYDLYRVVPWESQRPGNSENVVVFEFWRFQTIVIGRQSWVKIEEKILRRGDVKKKRHGHNFEFWALKLNQCHQHGCFTADSISSRNSQNCGRVFFFLTVLNYCDAFTWL